MYARLAEQRLREALADTPAVFVVGPRRAGKTTLARKVGGAQRSYVTLDDPTTLSAARTDPVGLIRSFETATIDEIQRAPELLLAIKKAIDDDYRPGRFLLTGSANALTLPGIADSLAGRVETLHLLPLARVEISGEASTFLDRVFAGTLESDKQAPVGADLIRLMVMGGFPEVISRATERRRQDWCRSYLGSILTTDLRDIAEIDKLTELPRFVRLLAQHSAQLVNHSALGAGINVNYKTSQRYTGLLEKIFLISTLPPWHTNAIKRIIKTSKLHFLDTGLLCASRGLTFDRLKADRAGLGAALETFVFAEVSKLMTGSETRMTPYHFRDQEMHEVDLVLERDDGQVVGIEVKASATVNASDFAGLRLLAKACKDRFAYGVVLYDSGELVAFGEKLAAAPLACLWN